MLVERLKSVPAIRKIVFISGETMLFTALKFIDVLDVSLLFKIKSSAEARTIELPVISLFTVRSPELPLVFMSMSPAAVIVPSDRSWSGLSILIFPFAAVALTVSTFTFILPPVGGFAPIEPFTALSVAVCPTIAMLSPDCFISLWELTVTFPEAVFALRVPVNVTSASAALLVTLMLLPEIFFTVTSPEVVFVTYTLPDDDAIVPSVWLIPSAAVIFISFFAVIFFSRARSFADVTEIRPFWAFNSSARVSFPVFDESLISVPAVIKPKVISPSTPAISTEPLVAAAETTSPAAILKGVASEPIASPAVSASVPEVCIAFAKSALWLMFPPAVTVAFPPVTFRRLLKTISETDSKTAPVAAVTAAPTVMFFPDINASASVVTVPFMLTSVSDMISALPVEAIEPVLPTVTVFASIFVVPPDVTAPLIVVAETDVIVVFPVDVTVFPIVTSFAESRLIFPAAMASSVIIEAFVPVVVMFKLFVAEAVPRVRFLSADVSHALPLPSPEPLADMLTFPFASTLIALPSAPMLPVIEVSVILFPAVRIALSLF